jgi:hypothetical protein
MFVALIIILLSVLNIDIVKGDRESYFTIFPLILKSGSSTQPTQEPTQEPTQTPTQEPTQTPTQETILPIGSTVLFDIFSGTITGAEKVYHLQGDSGTIYPNQVFVIAFVDVENLGYVSGYVSTFDLQIRDSVGRLFDMADLEVQWAAQDQYGLTGVYEDIQPSFFEQQVYAFDVALDSQGLELVADEYSQPITPTPNPVPTSIVNIGTPGSTEKWQYKITNVINTNTLTGYYGTVVAKGEFLVVFAEVTNLSLEADYVSHFDFVIQDSNTRQFDFAELEVQWAAQDQYGLTGVYEDIQPSFTKQQVYVIDIHQSANGLYFLPTESGDAVYLNQ